MLEMIIDTLKQIGFTNIESATDGELGLSLIEKIYEIEQSFDLIVSDIMMPNLNGIQLVEKCQENLNLRDTPIILATTESEKEMMLKGLMVGAKGYIVKPGSSANLWESTESK